jgi:hypothetical protein
MCAPRDPASLEAGARSLRSPASGIKDEYVDSGGAASGKLAPSAGTPGGWRLAWRGRPCWPQRAPYILNTPNFISGMGACRLAASANASAVRVSAGSSTPSSQSRAVEKYGLPSRS